VASAPAYQGRLFRRYVVIFAVLVSGGLLASGLVGMYFSYQENQAAVIRLQRGTAVALASRIEQLIRETEHQIGWVVETTDATAPVTVEQRRSDYLKLLRQAPAVGEVRYLDAGGIERIRVGRSPVDATTEQSARGVQTAFLAAKSGQPYFGPIYFGERSEPYMTIAIADGTENAGVTVAEVDLTDVWDAVSQVTIGSSGYAYVVDRDGRLIAHPDTSLVVQNTDLSASLAVQTARAGPIEGRQTRGQSEVVDPLGPSVIAVSQHEGQRFPGELGRSSEHLVAYQTITPPGWTVFVDQPLEEAFGSVRAAIVRTVLLLLMGLLLAVLASLFFVRKMVTPIQALQAGAARIGAGALDQRIDVRTGDELESLAEEFNAMAAQLRESYADLEQKVEDRTREVAEKSRELELASQHKSEFLANMSHELRTPLNAILGFSEVLLERMFGDLNERQEEYLRDILTSGQHLLALINDILDLSKVEAGRMDLELEEFSLPDALEHGLTMLRERASNHGITLGLTVDPGVDLIQADERKIKQVVFNLLSNAVKFTPDGGQIDVSAHVDGEDVLIAVRDTGVGISLEDQERLFEEFRQVGETSRQVEGTGLGLALSKKFVELHGGRIEVESDVGVGSTFTVHLPIRQGAPLGAADAGDAGALHRTPTGVAHDP
jgi:two-component system, NtrC family, sensor kinase